MAAIFAAAAGAEATIVERTRDGGRKILISGGGRCNVLPAAVDEARFVTDSSPHTLRNILRSWPLGEQIDAASKSEIEDAIKDVNEAVKGSDADDIRAKTERLQTAFHRVSEAMYERAQASQQQEPSPNGASGDGADEEEVVDAEVVDEQK